MIERQFEQNIEECVKALKNEGVVLYPADTVYGLGCLATSNTALEKLYQIKGRDESKASLVLIDNIERLQPFRSSPLSQEEIAEINSEQPTTVILDHCINLPKLLLGPNDSLGVRLVKNHHLVEIINSIEQPLVSTSANFSGEPTPLNFKDISQNLIEKLDFSLNSDSLTLTGKPSRIVKFTAGKLQIIRA